MTKYFYTILLALSVFFMGNAQILEPAKWSFESSKKSLLIGQEVDLIFKVSLDSTWYIYSNDFEAELGPTPTVIRFEPHPSYELVGDAKAFSSKKKKDKLLGVTYNYMDENAGFTQRIRILEKKLVIKGDYEFLTCTLVDGKCIPGDGEFDFSELIHVAD